MLTSEVRAFFLALPGFLFVSALAITIFGLAKGTLPQDQTEMLDRVP